jgi:hypothetical protein
MCGSAIQECHRPSAASCSAGGPGGAPPTGAPHGPRRDRP